MRPDQSRGLTIALWIARGLLFVFFAMAGVTHGFLPVAEVAKSAPWASEVPVALLRFIGLSELAGAVGVLVPSLTRLAALGLATIMMLATIFHLSRGESRMVLLTLTVAVVAAFVAVKGPRR